MDNVQSGLTALDYGIFVVYAAIILCVGLGVALKK